VGVEMLKVGERERERARKKWEEERGDKRGREVEKMRDEMGNTYET